MIYLYGKPDCPNCGKATRYLKSKQVPYTTIDVRDPDARNELIDRAPLARTLPQAFDGEAHIGGYEELHAYLEKL